MLHSIWGSRTSFSLISYQSWTFLDETWNITEESRCTHTQKLGEITPWFCLRVFFSFIHRRQLNSHFSCANFNHFLHMRTLVINFQICPQQVSRLQRQLKGVILMGCLWKGHSTNHTISILGNSFLDYLTYEGSAWVLVGDCRLGDMTPQNPTAISAFSTAD